MIYVVTCPANFRHALNTNFRACLYKARNDDNNLQSKNVDECLRFRKA